MVGPASTSGFNIGGVLAGAAGRAQLRHVGLASSRDF